MVYRLLVHHADDIVIIFFFDDVDECVCIFTLCYPLDLHNHLFLGDLESHK